MDNDHAKMLIASNLTLAAYLNKIWLNNQNKPTNDEGENVDQVCDKFAAFIAQLD